jgi:hypothetical protein
VAVSVLPFARAHFGDLALVQRDAAHHLHVEVAHLHDALGRLAHDGEGLGQHVVRRLALGQALAELLGLGLQRVVGQLFELGSKALICSTGPAVLLEQPVVAGAEDFGQEVGGHERGSAAATRGRVSAIPLLSAGSDGGAARVHKAQPHGKAPDFTRGEGRLPCRTGQ